MEPPTQPGWDGARNLADLGGWPLAGGGTTASGRVWRSAAPEWLTDDGWAAARAAGLARVVDLRNDAERGRREHHPVLAPGVLDGVEVVAAPTEDPDDPAFLATCGPWLDHPRSWAPNLALFPGLVAHALGAVASSPGPVLVHCAGGRDRTGLVCSVLLGLAGVEPAAVADAYEAGFRGAAAHRGHGLAWDPGAGWVEQPDAVWSPEELDAALADRRPVLLAWLATTDLSALLLDAGLSPPTSPASAPSSSPDAARLTGSRRPLAPLAARPAVALGVEQRVRAGARAGVETPSPEHGG